MFCSVVAPVDSEGTLQSQSSCTESSTAGALELHCCRCDACCCVTLFIRPFLFLDGCILDAHNLA